MSNLLILASIFYFFHPLIKKWNLFEDFDKWKLDKKDHLYKKDINQSYIMQEIIQLLEIKINETMTNHTNEDEMLNDLINGIKNDDIPSLDKCGNLFEFGYIVEQNNTLAAYIYKYEADKGYNDTLIKYKLRINMKKAADAGFLPVVYYYASMLYYGDLGVVNKKIAAHYFKIGADKKHPLCISEYARMLEIGDEVDVNKTGAAHYYKIGSYLSDLKIKESIDNNDAKKERAFYTKKAFECGDLNSTYEYAMILLNGFGVETDEKEAAVLMKEAADKGHLKSKLKYGLMLYKGIGVEVNKLQSISYIEESGHENVDVIYYIHCIKENIAFDQFIKKELSFQEAFEDEDMHFLNVTVHSLGVEAQYGKMSVIIPRLTSIPTKMSESYTTFHDNQTSLTFKVFEGENFKACNNTFLGSIRIKNISLSPLIIPTIRATIKVDSEGIVTISVHDIKADNIEEKMFDKRINILYEEIFNIFKSKKELENIWFQIRNNFLNTYLVKSSCQSTKDRIYKKIKKSFIWIYDHRNEENSILEANLNELKNILYKRYEKNLWHLN